MSGLTFVVMRNALILVAGTLLACFSTGCTKQDAADADHAAFIAFRTDSGFIHTNDTVPLSDTLNIGVTVTKGSDDLTTLYVDVTYDNALPLRQDSVHVIGNPFNYQRTLITRDLAGQEKWTFRVVEPDGDATTRNLTLTVH